MSMFDPVNRMKNEKAREADEETSRMTSPSTERRYPLASICRLWGL